MFYFSIPSVYNLLIIFIIASFVQPNQFYCRERPGLWPTNPVYERNNHACFQGERLFPKLIIGQLFTFYVLV